MTRCKTCKKEVAISAKTCPHCGQKKPGVSKESEKTILIMCIIIAGFVTLIRSCGSETTLREKQIQQHFNAWDGSHNELTKLIKFALYNKESYEHIKTRYWDDGGFLIVETTYSAKNDFGERFKKRVKAKVDLNGNVIAILEEE